MVYDKMTREQLIAELVDLRQADKDAKNVFDMVERAKQEWEAVADSISDIICLIDNKGLILRANLTVEKWNLGNVKEVKGKTIHELLHSKCTDPQCYLRNFWPRAVKELAEGRSSEIEGRDQILNIHLNVKSIPIIHTAGIERTENAFAILIVKDITKRIRAMEELRRSEEKYRDLFENAHEMILAANLDGQILKNNAMTRQTFGYSDEEMQGLKIIDLFRITERSGWKKVSESIRRRSYWRGDLTAICRDGREFPADVTVSRPGGTTADKTTNIICIIRDVTEEKEIDRMKNEFISTVSHELRTPLSITKEGISLVLDKIPGKINKQQEELLGTALKNIDRLARIINGLLDISKIEARKIELKREGVDIVSVINQVMSSFEQKLKSRGLKLKTSFPDNSLQVYIDEDKTVQIFTNIISNSLKFTEKGYIGISAKENDDKVECIISDSGKGISKDDMPKLFNKFQQFGRTAGPGEKGTGLGLSIVKNLVELQGGEIKVRSGLNKGTDITVILPRYTMKNILKENVQEGINNAAQTGESYSLLLIETLNFCELEKQVKKHEADKVFGSLLDEVKKLLRHNCDILVEDHSDIFILLPHTSKGSLSIVLDRIRKTLENNIKTKDISVFRNLNINIRGVTYPNDADTCPEMLKKISEGNNGE